MKISKDNKNYRYKFIDKGIASPNVFYGISSKIKCFERTIICIKEDNKIYKVISVTADKKDGSIYAFFNYCKEKDAFVLQHKHKYKGGPQMIKKSQITKEFIVDKTAKLSIHRNGFVQLSGNGILSGINEKTGKPRGIGVFSSPLDQPVSSGPTFAFTCWGLKDGFELLNKQKKNIQYIILNKNKNDFVERRIGLDENKLSNAFIYVLEFYIFPQEANRFIYEYKKEPFINHIIDNYLFDPGATFAHPVLDLKYFNEVLCIFPAVTRYERSFADNSSSGYTIGSPGGSDCIDDKSMTGNVFHLICPRKNHYPKKKNTITKLEY